MLNKDKMTRTTFSSTRKYYIRAEARWVKPSSGSAKIFVRAEVFEGSPTIIGNEHLFLHQGEADTTDLLDALQSGEAIARQYVATLP